MFGIFRNTTVDAVLANFNKTIEDLRSIQETHMQLADQKKAQAMKLTAESHGHNNEAVRASMVAEKIGALISTDK